ncbi:hypothetical protein SH584_03290 [Sphingomonas sp. LY29]|uniref:hypothetical protein n=1 Tax=unclassified Sphingomonas TaxID=196159 RepID=UPI002ADEFA42|nr:MULTISPECIES: hypothetical protein [unclassified Sphingomonas]MEA1073043.1 hypothetical protein [Sphingomonas sp. LY160]WRP26475.1 hypothetical protein SH584_03290 [Sphingomonas sp. LY29]
MSNQSDFYLARALEERTKADASALANVRDGHLRAAAAWDALASRSVKADRMREEEERRKAEVKLAGDSVPAY